MSQCLRRISGLCSLKAAHKVGRVTPCAPQFLWYFANGAHGVTRRTLPGSHTMLVAFLLAGLQVRGAEASPNLSSEPLSLAQAQRIAFESNWDLLAAAKGIDSATAQKIIAHEFPNPTLSLATMKINIDHHASATAEGNGFWDRNYDTIFAINQLFEIGGKRRSRQASAKAGYEAARAQFFDAKRTLDLALTRAYAAAALAEENVRVLNQSAETLRQEAKIADVRLRAGEISESDKSQIEIIAERFELDARAAESAAAQARISLEILLGTRHPNSNLRLSDQLEALAESAPAVDTNYFGVARPDVVAAEAGLRKAEADLHLQRASRIPDPTLLAQYEHEPPDQPNTSGFGLSFPLPLWNRNRGNILAAEAAREEARLALEKTRAVAAADLATARLAYEDAARRWQNYRASIRPRSDQVRKTIAYSYERGGASLLDLLTAERNDNDIRLAAAQAANDTAIAAAALKAALYTVPLEEKRK